LEIGQFGSESGAEEDDGFSAIGRFRLLSVTALLADGGILLERNSGDAAFLCREANSLFPPCMRFGTLG
jgi:hypothetical protein